MKTAKEAADIPLHAPLCVFGYKRADIFKGCLSALANCTGSTDTDLRIYIDGPKGSSDKFSVEDTCKAAECIDRGRFKSVSILKSTTNKGLASSIIAGVTETINVYGSVIVVEDDLIATSNFLEYMNASLVRYRTERKVGSISGFGFLVNNCTGYANYFHPRPNSWGWATWSDRWEKAIWNLEGHPEFANPNFKKAFNAGGQDLYRMLMNFGKGKIDSWAIRWAFTHYVYGWLASCPTTSKITNLGYGVDATNCIGAVPPPLALDPGNNLRFKFASDICEDSTISKQVNWYNSNAYKILNKLRQTLAVNSVGSKGK